MVGTETSGRCLVMSDGSRTYRAAVPPVLLATPLLVAGGELLVAGLILVTLGVARALFWWHCRDDSLWDDGEHLLWSRAGRVMTASKWSDLTRVYLESSLPTPEWGWGRRSS